MSESYIVAIDVIKIPKNLDEEQVKAICMTRCRQLRDLGVGKVMIQKNGLVTSGDLPKITDLSFFQVGSILCRQIVSELVRAGAMSAQPLKVSTEWERIQGGGKKRGRKPGKKAKAD